MTGILASLPPNVFHRLTHALDSGAVAAPYTEVGLLAAIGRHDAALLPALEQLRASGIEDRAAATWLRELHNARAKGPRLDLVWSGPEMQGLPARDTRQVVRELFTSAERSLWAVSYAYYDGPAVFGPLAAHMIKNPDLTVRLVLNVHRKTGDTTRAEDLVVKFANKFWDSGWPGDLRPRVYYDPRSAELSEKGVLHSKTIVADEKRLLITSANFTTAALDQNIELGVLVRDHALARRVVMHFRGLIERNLLLRLPDP